MTRYHATSNGNIDFTAEEEAARDLEEVAYLAGTDTRLAALAREKRSMLLSHTDWAANSDISMSAAMTIYRQSLRDIPEQDGFPNEITWPDKPA